LRIVAEFITSATNTAGFPREGLAEVAFVGRSNVGKSSLINALLRQRMARTSAAPGKTRLANVFRVVRGSSRPFYLVDLPGYGYARGGHQSAEEFQTLADDYFRGAAERRHAAGELPEPAALLLVDARHPGLDSDRSALRWLQGMTSRRVVVATKIDKLPRGQRIRALREIESVLDELVLPVSAITGEGLDELWKLIDRLANLHPSNPPRPQPRSTPKTAQ
jgi:GTP-binding protein